MFETTIYDTVTYVDGFEETFEHDVQAENYYFNGGETFTAEDYARWEAISAQYEEDYEWFNM